MFRQMLFVHWKAARFLLLPLVVLAFGLPLLSVQGLVQADSVEAMRYFLDWPEIWAGFFPLLATVGGAMIALTAWTWDHQQDHVYALSLPLARWEYALLKMGAGMVLLVPFAAALWVGSLAASASVELPEGVRAYPHLLAGRFLMASVLVYGILFAMGGATIRTVMIVLSALAAFMVLGDIGADHLAGAFPVLDDFDPMAWWVERMVTWPGPFEVFTGNWILIDV